MSYKVKLQTFEGPFDLLVYLIENAQMSIYDIEIKSITGQYLEYIKAMQEMDIAVATEFMVLASSLIEIKSKMILPRISESGENMIEEDPRRELVARLVEYKKFKQAARILQEQEEAAESIFEKNIQPRSWKNRRRILRHIQESRTSISASILNSSPRLSHLS